MKKLFIFSLIIALSLFLYTKLDAYGYGYVKRGNEVDIGKYAEQIKGTNSYYKGEGKKLYLTFDCGYENGYTEKILAVLKEKKVPATFFITGHYLKQNTNLVKRMVEEKHIIGNHTAKHRHLTEISDEQAIADITLLEKAYLELIGEPIHPFYRPPAGLFTREKLLLVKDLGYNTLFWSLAYRDWDQNLEGAKALKILEQGLFDGAIILLHAVSKTNAMILADFIDLALEKGYQFSSPYDFLNNL